ncbi:D-alanine--D-alanine ligase family protein, partial [Propionibacterium sp.]|uniref:D-alanine--D-alanine ligase family protein n=1 Tax=Propionibacterium sp. TaxID=1977903 RepID=UPI0039E7F294
MTASGDNRINVALIFGGQSTEHEVSCLTAAGVLSAIDQSRYRVHGIGIDKHGVWHRYRLEEIAALQVRDGVLPSINPIHPEATLVRGADGVSLITLAPGMAAARVRIDLAFPVLHGAYCEDGTIQGHFEMLGLRYVGCGVTSSAMGMDKQFMRTCFEQAGIPLAPWLAIGPHEWPTNRTEVLDRIEHELGFPVFVKPARGGSSVGISRVRCREDLPEAIEQARACDPKVVVEQGVTGAREIECGVLAADPAEPKVSVPGEIVMHANEGFYDYSAKYLPEEQVELCIPATMDATAQTRIRELAIRCFEALDCEGLARVDLFLRSDGEVLVNEINTMPGFTAHSMYPSLWRSSGIEYPELIDQLIRAALTRPGS